MKLKDAYSLEEKLWPNLDSILKSRDITLPTKVRLVKAMVFPVVMYGYESWTIKKAECWRIMLLNHGVGEALDSPLDCKEIKPGNPKGNQPWIFIGRTDAEAEIPILWPRGEELTPGKRPWCWERLRAGGEGDDRGWDGQMASSTRWTWVWASCGSWWWTGRPGMLQSIGFQRVGHDWATELNWRRLPKIYWALDTTRHHPEGSLWMSAFKRQTSPMTQAQSLPVFVTHEEPKAWRLEGIFSGHPLVSDRPRV